VAWREEAKEIALEMNNARLIDPIERDK
jgi:hypothetical protein